ncbi:MAG: polysaccharide deacetylase family protein, partial [Alphaproteobacteria bacterium]|nr:polysaccharide deacetylase family protein [Alphaproteobacteria bacterium]
MKKSLFIIVSVFYLFAFTNSRQAIIEKYSNVTPQQWGENISGVIKTLPTKNKVLALTLDACGSKNDSLDEDLIAFLTENEIPATLFINYRWIKKYPEKFEKLYSNPLFEIENHGHHHVPASLNGNSIYGIKGTANSYELFNEVVENANYIEKITGRRPKFYRSGTAYYDEYAVRQIYDMGFIPIGFNILGDAGATYTAEQVKNALLKSKPADIIIAHANHPEKQ